MKNIKLLLFLCVVLLVSPLARAAHQQLSTYQVPATDLNNVLANLANNDQSIIKETKWRIQQQQGTGPYDYDALAAAVARAKKMKDLKAIIADLQNTANDYKTELATYPEKSLELLKVGGPGSLEVQSFEANWDKLEKDLKRTEKDIQIFTALVPHLKYDRQVLSPDVSYHNLETVSAKDLDDVLYDLASGDQEIIQETKQAIGTDAPKYADLVATVIRSALQQDKEQPAAAADAFVHIINKLVQQATPIKKKIKELNELFMQDKTYEPTKMKQRRPSKFRLDRYHELWAEYNPLMKEIDRLVKLTNPGK